jgi:hypothetical protein
MFTASIDLTLNMLVKGFPGSDGILLLRPKVVLIGKHFPAPRMMLTLSLRYIRHHLQHSPDSRWDLIRNFTIRRPKGRRIRYKPLFRPERPQSRVSATSSILGDLYRFPRSSYLASEPDDQEPPFGREAI